MSLQSQLETFPASQLAAWLVQLHEIGGARVQRKIELWAGDISPSMDLERFGNIIRAIDCLDGSERRGWDDPGTCIEDIESILDSIVDLVLPVHPAFALSLVERLLHRDVLLETCHDECDEVWSTFELAVPAWVECAKVAPAPTEGWCEHLLQLAHDDPWGIRSGLILQLPSFLSESEIQSLTHDLQAAIPVWSEAASLLDSLATASGNTALLEENARLKHGELWQETCGIGIAEVALKTGRPLEALERLSSLPEALDSRRIRALAIRAHVAAAQPEKALELLHRDFLEHPSQATFEARLVLAPEDQVERFRQDALELAQRIPGTLGALDIYLCLGNAREAEDLCLTKPSILQAHHYSDNWIERLTRIGAFTAAALLHRKELEEILNAARSRAYGHALAHYRELIRLEAKRTRSWPNGTLEHEAFLKVLHAKHHRKHAFWSRVG